MQVSTTAAAVSSSAAGAASSPVIVDSEPTLTQGTWNIKQWKKVQEPGRNKTHWDYLLQEMEWLSKDFREERQWKVALAKKAVKAVSRWHTERALDEKSGRLCRTIICGAHPLALRGQSCRSVRRLFRDGRGPRSRDARPLFI